MKSISLSVGVSHGDAKLINDMLEKRDAEIERLKAILRDIWDDGMQDGLSRDLRDRVDAEVGEECRSRPSVRHP